MINISMLTDSNHSRWDEYVRSSPSATFTHLSGWRHVYQKSYKFEPLYLLATTFSNRIVGILPMVLMRDVFLKKYLVSNPYATSCGVSADDDTIKNELLQTATQIAIKRNVEYLEFRNSGKAPEDQEMTKHDFVTMTLDLTKGEDYIWKNLVKGTVRTSVRKAIKQGLQFDYGKQYLHDFYRVFSINMRDLGTPVHSKQFFINIIDTFNDYIEILVVKLQGKVIGAMFCFWHNQIIAEPWVSTLRKYRRMSVADFLYWEAIRYACERGHKKFDFGRSTINSGTFHFKKKWGAFPKHLNYSYILHLAKTMPVCNAMENRYEFAINMWKKCPLPVANIVGPRLVQCLPEL